MTAGSKRWDAQAMVVVLGGRVKPDEALREVTRAAERLVPGARSWDKDTALLILDALTAVPGAMGVTARFAKARLILADD